MATQQSAAAGKITLLKLETIREEQLTFGWSHSLISDIT